MKSTFHRFRKILEIAKSLNFGLFYSIISTLSYRVLILLLTFVWERFKLVHRGWTDARLQAWRGRNLAAYEPGGSAASLSP